MVSAVRGGLHGENLLVGEEDVLEAVRSGVTEKFFRTFQPILLDLVRQRVSLQ